MVMRLPAHETAGDWLAPTQLQDLALRLQQEQADARDRQQLLERAHAQAADELTAARAVASTLLAQARADAERLHAETLEAARTQAAQAWHAQRAAQAQALATWEQGLAALVCGLVERLVGEQPARDRFARALQLVQAELNGATRLRLRVAPADEVAAREALAALPLPGGAKVLADARLQPGDCLAETDLGLLDAGLSAQLQALREWLESASPAEALAEPAPEEAEPS